MKKNLAVLFGVTADYSFALGNVLYGLRQYSPELADDIIVYHDGLSEEEQARLNAILPCRFVVYEPPVELPGHHLSKLTFSRVEGFSLLREYRQVLWLDVDLLIRGDLSDILKYGGSGIACCYEPRPLGLLFPDLSQPPDDVGRCDLTKPYFNSGVMLLSDALERPEDIREWLYSLVRDYPKICLKSADQGAINLAAQVFGVPVTALPERFNQMICNDWHPAYQFNRDARIVHAITENKFWNYWFFREWEQRYCQWVDAGGAPAAGYRAPWRRPWGKHILRKMRYLKKRTSSWRHDPRRKKESVLQ